MGDVPDTDPSDGSDTNDPTSDPASRLVRLSDRFTQPRTSWLAPGRQPRIAVIGGSLTGPVAALLMLHAGFDHVDLYEAVTATAPRGGGLIALEHSALDILDHLGIGQDEIVRFPSEHIVQMTMHDGRTPEVVRRVYPGRNTTWTMLHHALVARLPENIVHKRRRVTGLATKYRQPNLHFADGSTVCADLVVFADGRSSAGRTLLDPNRQLHYAGYIAHRGTAPAVPGLADFLRIQPTRGVQFNIAPIPDGTDWTFYLNDTADTYTTLFGAPPHQRVFALPRHVTTTARAYVNDHAAAQLPAEYAALVHATTTRMAVPILDIDPPTQMVWPVGAGHAVLLGDALAPVRPHTARGANNGIEQAAGLVAVLTQIRKYGGDITAALHGWQRRHLPTAQATLRLGPAIGSRLSLGTTHSAHHGNAPGHAPQ